MSAIEVPVIGQPVPVDYATWVWASAYSYIVIAIMVIIAVAIGAYHLWQNHKTPLESKRIAQSCNSRKSALLIVNDDGNTDVKIAWTINSGEGYTSTKPEGKWKWHWTGMFPQSGLIPSNIDVSENKDLAKTRSAASVIAELNTKKLHLRGARIPFWVGVQSQAILMSLNGLASLEVLELFELWFNSMYPNKIFPVDVHAVKRMVFGANYSESQINSIESDSEHIGEERAKKGEGLNKIVLFAGIAFAAIGLIALGVAAFIG